MNKVTVVGSGVMGKGIAYTFATEGFQVYLNDLSDDILGAAKKEIDHLLEMSYEKGFLKEGAYQHAKENIIYETSLQKAAENSSTRLNSSHVAISYAVFCLKKKKNSYQKNTTTRNNE